MKCSKKDLIYFSKEDKKNVSTQKCQKKFLKNYKLKKFDIEN